MYASHASPSVPPRLSGSQQSTNSFAFSDTQPQAAFQAWRQGTSSGPQETPQPTVSFRPSQQPRPQQWTTVASSSDQQSRANPVADSKVSFPFGSSERVSGSQPQQALATPARRQVNPFAGSQQPAAGGFLWSGNSQQANPFSCSLSSKQGWRQEVPPCSSLGQSSLTFSSSSQRQANPFPFQPVLSNAQNGQQQQTDFTFAPLKREVITGSATFSSSSQQQGKPFPFQLATNIQSGQQQQPMSFVFSPSKREVPAELTFTSNSLQQTKQEGEPFRFATSNTQSGQQQQQQTNFAFAPLKREAPTGCWASVPQEVSAEPSKECTSMQESCLRNAAHMPYGTDFTVPCEATGAPVAAAEPQTVHRPLIHRIRKAAPCTPNLTPPSTGPVVIGVPAESPFACREAEHAPATKELPTLLSPESLFVLQPSMDALRAMSMSQLKEVELTLVAPGKVRVRFLRPVDLLSLPRRIDEIVEYNAASCELSLYESVPAPPVGEGLNVPIEVTICHDVSEVAVADVEAEAKELEGILPGFTHVAVDSDGRQTYRYTPCDA